MTRAVVIAAAIGLSIATGSCSKGSGGTAADAGDSAVDSPPVGTADAADSRIDSPPDGMAGGCGAGTVFCNSACGICVLVGGPCRIDTCGTDGNGGEPCGNGPRCGDGTRCVNVTCVPL